MTNLKYYRVEKDIHADAFAKKINRQKVAQIVIDKLVRHFKLRTVYVHYTSGNRSSHASVGGGSIRINIDYCNFGIICHELSHIIQARLINSDYESWHNKEHAKIMKRMINYCRKKSWFESEIARRTATKIQKIPDQNEMKEKELTKIQEKIVVYRKKIKFYENKLKKAKKSYSLKLAWIKRQNDAIRSPTIEDNGAVDTKSLPDNLSQLDLNKDRGIGV